MINFPGLRSRREPAQLRPDSAPFQSATLAMVRQLIPSPAARFFAYVSFWTIVAFVSALHWWFYPQGNYPYTWWQLFLGKSAVWYTWGAITPLVFWLGHRFRLDSGSRLKHALILTSLATVVTLAYLVSYTQWILLVIGANSEPNAFANMFRFVISMHSTYYFLAFWALIAIEHTVAYYLRFLERERQTAQLEKLLVEAQIARLRSQLHPHFLFNTLNTVSSLVLTEQNSQAYDALAELAELLRISLDRNEMPFVSLDDEIEFNRIYVGLMKRRFPDRLDVRWSIDPMVNRAMVPNMILQPLIENAVKYGVEGDSSRASVTISAQVLGDRLQILVENNYGDHAVGGHGIGLSQTRQRLAAHYGEKHQLLSGRCDDNRFQVSMVIPYEESSHTSTAETSANEEIQSSHRR